MNLKEFESKILTPLSRWSPLGTKKDSYGTNYIGHIFKDAPLGFLHVLYEGINLDEISKIERELGRSLPLQFKEFLQLSNGASFYSPSGLNIYGALRIDYYPEFETKPWRFPSSIVAENNYGWLTDFSDTAVVLGMDEGVGSYIISPNVEGPIIEFDVNEPESILAQWDNFDHWITSSLDNLFVEHDDSGALLEIGKEVH